jgi:hypothetical protein
MLPSSQKHKTLSGAKSTRYALSCGTRTGRGGVGVGSSMFHYTNVAGFNGIRSSPIWRFLASQPPGEHPRGAYFTTLDRDTPRLAARLRIPKAKLEYFFEFTEIGDLKPLPGGRGNYIFYSPEDYKVVPPRQLNSGKTEET